MSEENIFNGKSMAEIRDIIRDFMSTKDPALKKSLSDSAAEFETAYIERVCESINKAISEGYEDLISSSPHKERLRQLANNEISSEEWRSQKQNDPKYIAYDEYIGAIEYRFADLELSAIVNVLTRAKNIPSYKVLLDRSFKECEKYTRKVQKATNCNSNTLSCLIVGLLHSTCSSAYEFYNHEKTKLMNELSEENINLRDELIGKMNSLGANTPEAEVYKKQITELDIAYFKFTEDYSSDALGFDKIVEFVKPILADIFKAPTIILPKDKNFLPMQQNNGVMDMLYNYSNLKKSTITGGLTKQLSLLDTEKGNQLAIQPNKDATLTISDVMNGISPSQVQLLCYIITIIGQQNNSKEIYLSLTDYCNAKDISKRTENKNKLVEDLQTLENIWFHFNSSDKNKNIKPYASRCLAVMDLFKEGNKDSIRLSIGTWIDSLNPDQYSLIHGAFFKYNIKNNPLILKFSLKLSEIVRNNLKKGKEQWALRVSNLVDMMDVSESRLKAIGFSKEVKDRIGTILDTIAAEEGYDWNYRKTDHINYKQFLDDYIEFSNPELLKGYANYNFKESPKKKKSL